MVTGINTCKDIIDLIATIITILGISTFLVMYFSYMRSIKVLNFNIITSCNSRFNELVDDLYIKPLNQKLIRQYIDLCHEQLFYYKKGYFKEEEIIKEWIDGMIDFLPIYSQGQCVNSEFSTHAKYIDSNHFLDNYSKLKKYFTIGDKFPIEKYYQEENVERKTKMKDKLVNVIMENIKEKK